MTLGEGLKDGVALFLPQILQLFVRVDRCGELQTEALFAIPAVVFFDLVDLQFGFQQQVGESWAATMPENGDDWLQKHLFTGGGDSWLQE